MSITLSGTTEQCRTSLRSVAQAMHVPYRGASLQAHVLVFTVLQKWSYSTMEGQRCVLWHTQCMCFDGKFCALFATCWVACLVRRVTFSTFPSLLCCGLLFLFLWQAARLRPLSRLLPWGERQALVRRSAEPAGALATSAVTTIKCHYLPTVVDSNLSTTALQSSPHRR